MSIFYKIFYKKYSCGKVMKMVYPSKRIIGVDLLYDDRG
jgi:hypothetical protein